MNRASASGGNRRTSGRSAVPAPLAFALCAALVALLVGVPVTASAAPATTPSTMPATTQPSEQEHHHHHEDDGNHDRVFHITQRGADGRGTVVGWRNRDASWD